MITFAKNDDSSGVLIASQNFVRKYYAELNINLGHIRLNNTSSRHCESKWYFSAPIIGALNLTFSCIKFRSLGITQITYFET